MKKLFMPALLLAVIMSTSCKKVQDVNGGNPADTAKAIAPDGFTFNTTKTVELNVKLLTNDNKPIQGVNVHVYPAANSQESTALFTAISDAQGNIKGSLTIPAYLDTLYIDPAYAGLMRDAKAAVKGSSITCTIGGADGFSGDIVPENQLQSGIVKSPGFAKEGGTVNNGTSTTTYQYLGSYDLNGRPTTRATSDVVSSSLLSFINASLPESKPVPTYHPDFLNTDAATDLSIEKTSDVWVTFVSEGAGYMNTLGFYTYPTANPPQTVSDISLIKIIIPNASLSGSAGAMFSGDKINIGRFGADTSIGFVLLQNAWNSTTHLVNTSATKFFGTDKFNVEAAAYRRHTVLLYDNTNKLFLQGFEDQQRDGGGSDNDFNDLVFYTTSNPVEGISTTNVNPIDRPVDTDGDGVNDTYDKFPNDATRAYIRYFPSESQWGTLAFEDLWPKTGDYDMNDMVVGYQYKYINNAANKTVEMYGSYTVRAIGASFTNGFGVQFPFTYNKISTVTGQRKIAGYITANSNGTEAGQTKAVIIPFDDTKALYPSGGFTNVYQGREYFTGDTAKLYISFASALTSDELGVAPYNPFVIANQRRGYEVHLAGTAPTDKADTQLFGTDQDRTSTATSKYYLTANNWPWGISIVEDFDYPTETSNISNAYTHFLDWAQSGGASYTNWYKSTSGYRNTSYIYSH